jgi:hypothetical protein
MDLATRIQQTNIPTFGNVLDEKIVQSAYRWIVTDASVIPEDAHFFLSCKANNEGQTIACEIVIEINGIKKGPFLASNEKTCAEALTQFN